MRLEHAQRLGWSWEESLESAAEVGYVAKVIEEVSNEIDIDPGRVCVAGGGEGGGSMAARVAGGVDVGA